MGDANGAGSNGSGNGKFLNPTPMLDELESGPWPSFVTGLKDLAERTKKPMLRGVMDQLEYSYQTKMGYWKGGLVTVKGYGAGIITRYSMIRDKLPEAAEFHTMRIQAPPGLHYNTKSLREICDIWEKHGTGLITLHGQTGDIMLQGIEADKVQDCFDELNQKGWDLGGAGAGMRTGVSCAGPARCEQACYDTLEMHEKVMKHFVGAVHRPEWNYKFKLKFSGCPNDCTNAIMRSDIAVIGMWRDSIQMDESAVKEWVDENGMEKLVNEVVSLCPTRAISLKEGGIDIDNGNCVHCMHCLNVMPKALSPGKERGVALLMGAKSTLKVGFNVGSMVVPFMKMETEEDIEEFIDLADEIIDWWDDNGLDHERLGETIERVSMKQFLDGVGLEPSIDMVSRPRDNPYFKTKY
ncbi:MAG: dissimilatory-type sulfite reductase subunit alpha [Chlorobium sp.]|nr:dissimilatory-type sulfite reductase subunit alpha [Chlorobium sp.]MCW8818833.1 dissimilatory-type sulfite reductase subunit alpha [Ignavibacteriaceae bacterium]